MALDFNKTFGKKDNTNGSNKAANSDARPKAQFWLNLGYTTEGTGKDGEDVFVSLPVGIPLDTQEKLPTNSSNKEYAQLQQARNDLMEQLLAHAKTLNPGDLETITFEVQLRRVREEAEESDLSENKFVRQLQFG